MDKFYDFNEYKEGYSNAANNEFANHFVTSSFLEI